MSHQIPPPQHWGNDELTKFLDIVHKNQFATFVHKPETKRIIGIDESFFRVLEGWIDPRDLTAALLMYRAHSAYRAAASCAFSGQSAELHPLLRLMLEQGGYAYLINRKPELGEVWLNRHESDADRAKVRSAFTFTNIRDALTSSLGEHLKNSYCVLYERTIDFGAHPNEMSITSNFKIMEKEDHKDYISNYLNSDGIDNSLRTLAQAGVCVLLIFQEIFRERFELLGVSSELPKLREGL